VRYRKTNRKGKVWRNKHHLKPVSRFGTNHKANLLLIHGERHILWHKMWGNRTLPEIIALLKRVQRAKSRQWQKVA